MGETIEGDPVLERLQFDRSAVHQIDGLAAQLLDGIFPAPETA